MKIKYEFVNGVKTEVEVDDAVGTIILDSRRIEKNGNRKERYHCYSLEGAEYEGEDYVSGEDIPAEYIQREDNSKLYAALDKLSEPQRRRLLQVAEGFSMQEIARIEGVGYFDDIRPEEWTPSYAGRSSRTDFLLKREKIFVEVKKTRKGLADKELGEQLTLDIAKYKAHPDCTKLYCFVYDPEGRIVNKDGIISDLENTNDGFAKIVIKPE